MNRTLRASILILAVAAAGGVTSVAAAEEGPPTTEQVLYALRDVRLPLDGLQVRNALDTAGGSTALLQLPDGTLVDVQLAAAQSGWAVRGVTLIAGSVDRFYAWVEPWRERVGAARSFLAGVQTAGIPTRSAEELAPLSWFEDPDQASRLWGMNPVTYRLLQTLQMMPALQGPMGGGTPTNPVPRRDQ